MESDAAEAAPGGRESPSKGVGTAVGPYVLVSQLGKGGFATVHLATDDEGEPHALKLFETEHGLDVDRAKADNEKACLRRLEHVNVLRLTATAPTPRGVDALVLEYCDGGDLISRLRRRETGGADDERAAYAIWHQIVDGVEHMHSRGIVHLDLKPQNVLLLSKDDANPVVKLCDFSHSYIAAEAGAELVPPTQVGAGKYMAPEVASGEAYRGESADVWSCGVILYTLLCGMLPFADADLIASAKWNRPEWFSTPLTSLLEQIFNTSPSARPSPAEIKRSEWYALWAEAEPPTPDGAAATSEQRQPVEGRGEEGATAKAEAAAAAKAEAPPAEVAPQQTHVDSTAVGGDVKAAAAAAGDGCSSGGGDDADASERPTNAPEAAAAAAASDATPAAADAKEAALTADVAEAAPAAAAVAVAAAASASADGGGALPPEAASPSDGERQWSDASSSHSEAGSDASESACVPPTLSALSVVMEHDGGEARDHEAASTSSAGHCSQSARNLSSAAGAALAAPLTPAAGGSEPPPPPAPEPPRADVYTDYPSLPHEVVNTVEAPGAPRLLAPQDGAPALADRPPAPSRPRRAREVAASPASSLGAAPPRVAPSASRQLPPHESRSVLPASLPVAAIAEQLPLTSEQFGRDGGEGMPLPSPPPPPPPLPAAAAKPPRTPPSLSRLEARQRYLDEYGVLPGVEPALAPRLTGLPAAAARGAHAAPPTLTEPMASGEFRGGFLQLQQLLQAPDFASPHLPTRRRTPYTGSAEASLAAVVDMAMRTVHSLGGIGPGASTPKMSSPTPLPPPKKPPVPRSANLSKVRAAGNAARLASKLSSPAKSPATKLPTRPSPAGSLGGSPAPARLRPLKPVGTTAQPANGGKQVQPAAAALPPTQRGATRSKLAAAAKGAAAAPPPSSAAPRPKPVSRTGSYASRARAAEAGPPAPGAAAHKLGAPSAAATRLSAAVELPPVAPPQPPPHQKLGGGYPWPPPPMPPQGSQQQQSGPYGLPPWYPFPQHGGFLPTIAPGMMPWPTLPHGGSHQDESVRPLPPQYGYYPHMMMSPGWPGMLPPAMPSQSSEP